LKGILSALLLAATSIAAQAQTPNLSSGVPAESFLGEQLCFETNFTNTGATGFGPYFRLILPPTLGFDSAEVFGSDIGGGVTVVGQFPDDGDPATTESTLTDPRIDEPVTGTEGFTYINIVLPVGSVVDGGPDLDTTMCLTIAPAAEIGVALPVDMTPVYEFGDTATGDNGPIVGDVLEQSVTPTVILFDKTDTAPESERPPGTTWPFEYVLTVDIANTATISELVISDTLPADFQFTGPVDISGGSGCAITTAPSTSIPGGDLEVRCTGDTVGTASGSDVVVRYSGHVIDILDEAVCQTAPVVNAGSVDATFSPVAGGPVTLPALNDSATVTAKHVAIQKSASGGSSPGAVVDYGLPLQVTDFGDADRLVLTDVLPDGVEFDPASVDVTVGGTAVNVAPDVTVNDPGDGTTVVVFDIGSAFFAQTGNDRIDRGTAISVDYQATVLETYRETGEPVLAADSLPNSVTADYDLVQGAAGCSDGSGASVSIVPVTIGKQVVNVQTFYEPGDPVIYRLTMQIPSGDTRAIRFEDFLPLPVLQVGDVDPDFSLNAADCPTSAGLCRGPDDTLGLTPDNITFDTAQNAVFIDWPDVSSTAAETIQVDLHTTVTDDPFADGLFLTNILLAQTQNTPGQTALDTGPVAIQVGAPELVMSKGVLATDGDGTIAPAPGELPVDGDIFDVEAGDEITFRLTIENVGSAEAFEVTLFDEVPTGLSACGAPDVLNDDGVALGFSGSLFDLADPLVLTEPLPGRIDGTGPPFGAETALVDFTCTVAASVQPEQVFTNFANGAYTSQPGGPEFPGIEDEAMLALDTVAPAKSLVASSESHTSDAASPPRAAIGEIVRYRLATRLPQGSVPDFRVRDLLPAGLQFIDDSTATVAFVDNGGGISSSTFSGAGLSVSGSAPDVSPTFVLPDSAIAGGPFGSGTDPEFLLGDLVNADDDIDDEFAVIEFNALVLNIDGNSAGSNRDNRYRVFSGGSQIGADSGIQSVRVVEPVVDIEKSASPTSGEAGTTIGFAVDLSTQSGTNRADAFDVQIADTVPGGLALDTGSIALAFGADCGAPSVVDNSGANTIEIGIDRLPAGCDATLRYDATLQLGVVPGSVLDNTASLVFSSLPGAGSDPNPTGSVTPGATGDTDGERPGGGSNPASVTIDSVVNAKSLVASTEPHTSGNDLAVGEIATYRLAVELPQGTSPAFAVVDTLETGLMFLDGTARLAFVGNSGGIASGDSGIGSSPQVTGNDADISPTFPIPSANITASGDPATGDTTLTFALGELVNGDGDTDAEFVVIEFDALMLNIAGNAAGVTRDNVFAVQIDGSVNGSPSNVQTIDVVEPDLVHLDKQAAPDNGVAGDRIDYSVSFDVADGVASADAFELQVVDRLPADVALDETTVSATFTSCGATDPAFTNASSGPSNEVRITFGDPLPEGCRVQIDYTAELLVTVQPGQTVPNTAEVDWTSLPGTNGTGGATPGTPGDGNGERTGSGGVNSHFDSTQAGVAIAPVTLAKRVFDTDSSFTGAGEFRTGVDDLAVGETATFRITATIPEGTTPQVVITDTLPFSNGVMERVSQSVVSIGSNLSVDNDPPVTAVRDDQLGDSIDDTVEFDFGEVINDPATATLDPDENRIVVEVVGRLVDVAANANSDELTNNALVQFGTGLDASASAGVDVVEPLLDIVKGGSITQGDAGDTVTYTVTIAHQSVSSTTAHDLAFMDTLPADMTLDVASIQVASGPAFDANTSSGNNIDLGWVDLDGAEIIVLKYQATLDETVMPAQMLNNTGDLSWTSMPGTVTGERTATDSDGHEILVTDPGVIKSVFATSESSTAAGQFGTPADLTIGEQVTYRFAVTFPEGMTDAAVVTDQLPTAASVLEVVSSRVVSIGGQLTVPGASVGDAGAVTDSDGDPANVPDRVTWSLGNVGNVSDNVSDAGDRMEFEVVAVVLDDPANQSGDTDQLNVATLDSASGTISGNVAVDLVAPELQLDKTVVTPSDGFVDAGDTVTVRLDIAHSGASTADAFNAVVTDTLPPDMAWGGDANVVSNCPGLNVDSSGNPVAFDFAQLELDLGACSIEYQIIVGDLVNPGQTLTNSVVLDYDSTPVFVSGQTRRRMDSDTAEVTVLAPALVKADVATNQPDTGMAQGDPALRDLTIGETVTYELTVVFPEGETDNVVLVDRLPADAGGVIEAIGAKVASVGANISTSLPGDAAFADARLGDGLNDTVTFDFGKVTNTPDGEDNAEDRIVIELVGRVVDVAANADGAVLINSAEFAFDGDGGMPLTDDATVEVVEPATDLSKTMALQADGVVRITLDVENTGSAPVYDLVIEDVFDEADWDLTGFNEVSVGSGFMLELLPDTSAAGQQTLRFATDPAAGSPDGTIPVGASVEAVFDIPLAVLPPAPNPLPNQADQVAADSLPGADDSARALPEQSAVAQIAVPNLQLAKTAALQVDADGSGSVSPGDTLRYKLLLENTGAGPASDIVIDDAPDANSTLVTGSVTTTAGTINTGNAPGDGTVQVALGTLAAGNSEVVAYETIVADPLPVGVTEVTNQAVFDAFELPPGVSDDPSPPGSDDPTVVPVAAAPDLVIVKDDGGVGAQPGDTVVYALDYQNAGNQDATGVVIGETVPSNAVFNSGASSPGWNCVAAGPGSSCEFTIGDLAAGTGGQVLFAVDADEPLAAGVTTIANAASIADDGANGDDPTPADNGDTDSTPVDAAPDLEIAKDDGGATGVPGGVVVYTLAYGNAGNQDATGAVLRETVPANTAFEAASSTPGWSCAPDNGPGSECTFSVGGLAAGAGGSADFAVRLDDPLPVGLAGISNLVEIFDDGNNGDDPTPSDNQDGDDTPLSNNPDLAIEKRLTDAPDPIVPGGVLGYEIVVTNTGNNTLTGVTIVDTLITVTGGSAPCASLAPGAECTLTGTYTVVQSDIDGGEVVNIATGDSDQTGPADAERIVPIAQNPALALDKSASLDDFNGNGLADVGETIDYTIEAINAGNVTLTGVVVDDPLLPGLTCTPSIPVASLSPGEGVACSDSLTVTQAMVDAGQAIDNTATASGTPPSGPDVVVGDSTSTGACAVETGAVAGVVWEDADRDAVVDAGEPRHPSFLTLGPPGATAGELLLAAADDNGDYRFADIPEGTWEVRILEAFLGNNFNLFAVGSPVRTVTVTRCADSVENFGFAPPELGVVGDFVWFDANENQSVDEFRDANGDGALTETPASAVRPANEVEWIDLNANGQADDGEFRRCGLQNVEVQLLDAAGALVQTRQTNLRGEYFFRGLALGARYTTRVDPGDPANFESALAFSGEGSCVELTQTLPATVDGGSGMPALAGCGATTALSDDSSVLSSSEPVDDSLDYGLVCGVSGRLALDKTLTDNADEDGSGTISAGDTLTFTVTATNTGSVTLEGVLVSDSLIEPGTVTCPLLAQQESCVLTGIYAVTQSDVDAGEIVNTATAGSDQTDPVETQLTTPVAQGPGLDLVKTAQLDDTNGNQLGDLGEIIEYTLTATNTGNVTLDEVVVDDPLIAPLACTPAVPAGLAPNEQIECTGVLEITPGELGGPIVNIASVTGLDPDMQPVQSSSTTETPTRTPIAVPTLSRAMLWLLIVAFALVGFMAGSGRLHRRAGLC